MCNSGVGLTPIIDGQVHHFAVAGLYNGLSLLWDSETGTYWEHITGQAIYGKLVGQQMEVWGIEMMTVESALEEYPEIVFYSSTYRSLKSFFLKNVVYRGSRVNSGGFIPPYFRPTMPKVDERLPEKEQGLGVFDGSKARFYPMKDITLEGFVDTWMNRPLLIKRRSTDKVPYAEWQDTENKRPMQLLLRWYGFILTFPQADIYQPT